MRIAHPHYTETSTQAQIIAYSPCCLRVNPNGPRRVRGVSKLEERMSILRKRLVKAQARLKASSQ